MPLALIFKGSTLCPHSASSHNAQPLCSINTLTRVTGRGKMLEMNN